VYERYVSHFLPNLTHSKPRDRKVPLSNERTPDHPYPPSDFSTPQIPIPHNKRTFHLHNPLPFRSTSTPTLLPTLPTPPPTFTAPPHALNLPLRTLIPKSQPAPYIWPNFKFGVLGDGVIYAGGCARREVHRGDETVGICSEDVIFGSRHVLLEVEAGFCNGEMEGEDDRAVEEAGRADYDGGVYCCFGWSGGILNGGGLLFFDVDVIR
jgi:hypothetical protein